MIRPLHLLAFLALPVAPAAAQHTAHSFYGDDAFGYLGWSLAAAGDVDGDGVVDLLLGERGGGSGHGAAWVFSGSDYRLLRQHVAPAFDDQLGAAVAGLGDVDGDGHDDYALGAPQEKYPAGCCTGFVWVVSGKDGAVLRQLTGPVGGAFGVALAGYFDADADGVGDLAVGEPWSDVGGTDRGAVHVYSGATGAKLFGVVGTETNARFGQDLVAAGDWDGDGHGDLLVSADRQEDNDRGKAWILSGLDGSELLAIPSPTPVNDAAFGRSVTTLGDVSGDGRPDFLIAAPGVDRAYVVSGSDGKVLRALDHPQLDPFSDRMHDMVARVADLDGDGRSDALVGGAGTIRIFSTSSGAVLVELQGADGFGYSVASPGDLTGDGLSELLVAALTDDTGADNAGRVDVVRLAPQAVQTYCQAAPNSAGPGARIGATGSTSISINDLGLTVSGGVPSSNALFFYGPQAIQVPFGNGYRCVGGLPTVRLPPALVITSAGNGIRPLDFSVPPLGAGAGAVVPGSTWYFQLWYRDPAAGGSGFNLSDGLQATFSP